MHEFRIKKQENYIIIIVGLKASNLNKKYYKYVGQADYCRNSKEIFAAPS